MVRRHPNLCVLAVYAGLALAMVGQGLLPGRALSASDYLWTAAPFNYAAPSGTGVFGSDPALIDSVLVFQPFFEHARAALPHIPLWNPYIVAGRPFLADAQSAVLSPFSLPAYLLPFWHSLAVIAFLKLVAAAFGTFVLGRLLRMRLGGALLAGLVYAFGLFTILWLSWPQTSIWVLLPWMLVATELLMRRPGRLEVLGLAAVVAAQYLGGHPEASVQAMLATLGFFAFRLAQARSRKQPLRGPLLAFSAAVALGTALAAVLIVPFTELALHSSDLATRGVSGANLPECQTVTSTNCRVTGLHTPFRFVLGVFLPEYWGRPTDATTNPFIQSNRAFYAGAITLLLAATAVIVRPKLERVILALVAVGVVAIVTGVEPLFTIVTSIPGLRGVRTDRLTFVALLAVALLAGKGLDELTGQRGRLPRANVVIGVGAAIVVLPVVVMAVGGTIDLGHADRAAGYASGFLNPSLGHADTQAGVVGAIRLGSLIQWLVPAGAGLLLIVLCVRGALSPRAVVVLAVGLLTVDLFRAGLGLNPAIPISHAAQPSTAAIAYLQGRAPNRFAGLDSEAGFRPLSPIPGDVAMRYHLYDVRGIDFPVIDRFSTFWSKGIEALGPTPHFSVPGNPTSKVLRTLRLMSVADLLEDPRDPPLATPGLRLAYTGKDARIYSIEGALPRAYLVGAQRTVEGEGRALSAVLSPGFDPRRVAVTEDRVPTVPAGASPAATGHMQADITRMDDTSMAVRVRSDRPALLILTDTYFPGWGAKVDGHSTRIYRANYLFRAVPVAAGVHQVEMLYAPASWRAGKAISAAAALIALVVAGVELRQRRRRRLSRV